MSTKCGRKKPQGRALRLAAGWPSAALRGGRGHKGAEQRVRAVGAAFEFRVVLHAHKKGVRGVLHGLHKAAVRRKAAQAHARRLQRGAVFVAHLIAVAVPLQNIFLAVYARQQAAGRKAAGVCAQAHGAALGQVALLVWHQVYHTVRVFRA